MRQVQGIVNLPQLSMRALMYFMALAAAAISLFAVTSLPRFLHASSVPLIESTGVIAEVRVATTRLSKSEAAFRLEGDSSFFRYPLLFPNYHYLSERLSPGKRVAIRYRDGKRAELWSLQLENETILDLDSAAQAHRRNGLITLALAVGMAAISYYFIRLASSM